MEGQHPSNPKRGVAMATPPKALVAWKSAAKPAAKPATKPTEPAKVAWRQPLQDVTSGMRQLQLEAATKQAAAPATSYWDWLPPELQDLILTYKYHKEWRLRRRQIGYRLLILWRLAKYAAENRVEWGAVFPYEQIWWGCECPNPRWRAANWRECAECRRTNRWLRNNGRGRLYSPGGHWLLRFFDDWVEDMGALRMLKMPHVRELVAHGRPERFWTREPRCWYTSWVSYVQVHHPDTLRAMGWQEYQIDRDWALLH